MKDKPKLGIEASNKKNQKYRDSLAEIFSPKNMQKMYIFEKLKAKKKPLVPSVLFPLTRPSIPLSPSAHRVCLPPESLQAPPQWRNKMGEEKRSREGYQLKRADENVGKRYEWKCRKQEKWTWNQFISLLYGLMDGNSALEADIVGQNSNLN